MSAPLQTVASDIRSLSSQLRTMSTTEVDMLHPIVAKSTLIQGRRHALSDMVNHSCSGGSPEEKAGDLSMEVMHTKLDCSDELCVLSEEPLAVADDALEDSLLSSIAAPGMDHLAEEGFFELPDEFKLEDKHFEVFRDVRGVRLHQKLNVAVIPCTPPEFALPPALDLGYLEDNFVDLEAIDKPIPQDSLQFVPLD
ncbi:hypothetical protein HPB52_016285 [Rhipicephalus sanguineus]|uniref:Uncharacterized protein n=1 Tax=Rhipicephalus sanguineus TaxID=34632 RepID=A0A9D4QBN0_RHISA|nr:hypothetical protein HPB52_016285 [Rhipicephalus sanguineus]